MNQVCIDANIWIKFLTEESDTYLAEKLIVQFVKSQTQMIAPGITQMEVGSILRKKYSRKLIEKQLLYELWNKFLSMPIVYFENKQLYGRAWEIAEQNHLTHLYDAVYLALADGIEFWTADERLVNSLISTNVKVKLLQRDL